MSVTGPSLLSLPGEPWPVNPFPTAGRVSERGQIGRSDVIGRLASRIARGENNSLLLSRAHRVGTSSVVMAVSERFRMDRWLVLRVDLAQGIDSSESLARALWRQCPKGWRLFGTKRWTRPVLRSGMDSTVHALREGAALGDAAGIGAASAVLDAKRADSLEQVLDRLGRVAARRPALVAIDDIDRIVEWDPGGRAIEVLAQAMCGTPRPRFLLAGHHASGLMEQIGVLSDAALPFSVPAISTEAWQHGLKSRFRDSGLTISDAGIARILYESDGHPQDTMRLCAHCLDYAEYISPEEALIDRALEEAKLDRTWRER